MDQLQGTQKPSVNGPPVFVARGLTKVYGTPVHGGEKVGQWSGGVVLLRGGVKVCHWLG